MQLSDFSYDLPEHLIAQTPCEPRDHSRLLVLDRETGIICHKHFYDLLDFIETGETLVFNNTKVIPARLHGVKPQTGAQIEVFLLQRLNKTDWEVLVKPGKKARAGTIIYFSPELQCEILENTDFGGRIIRFQYEGIFEEILDRLGETPLPPYIKLRLEDKNRYQTVYAKEDGSAAAPTAGLHFTPELLEKFKEKGVNLAFITLHVGIGTFRPVSVQDITKHVMHREFYSVSSETADLINKTKLAGKRVIAVGTTSIRTLETAGASGIMLPGSGWTDIFIYPGYTFKMSDAICTNFHLPESTLLMLISAFANRQLILSAYQEAVDLNYRFFSFGDAMFIK